MSIQFVVEDGTGKTDATTYVSLDDLHQYWDNMGYDYGNLSATEQQVLLNKASKILDAKFRWPGLRGSSDQALEWPRIGAWYQDGWSINGLEVPIEIKNAVCELVYAENAGISLQPVVEASGIVKSESVSVGPVRESKTYFGGSASGRDKVTAVSDALIRIIGKGAQLNLLRV